MEGISVVRSSSSYVFVLICKATMLISLSGCLHPVVAEQVQLDFCKECSSSWNETSLHNHRLLILSVAMISVYQHSSLLGLSFAKFGSKLQLFRINKDLSFLDDS